MIMSSLDHYLAESSSSKRLNVLCDMQKRGERIPQALVNDLLEFDFPIAEKVLLTGLADDDNKLALEFFLVDRLYTLQQDIAVAALENWNQHTPHQLWFQIALLASNPHTPQRLLYRLVEASHFMGTSLVLRQVDRLKNLMDLSPAFHGLLLHRAAMANFRSASFDKLAESLLTQFDIPTERAVEKAMAGAVCYLACFNPSILETVHYKEGTARPWMSLLSAVRLSLSEKSKKGRTKIKSLDAVPVWVRSTLDADELQEILSAIPHETTDAEIFHAFAGIDVKVGLSLLNEKDLDRNVFANGVRALHLLCDEGDKEKIAELCKQRLQGEEDVSALLALLSDEHRVILASQSKGSKPGVLTKLAKQKKMIIEHLKNGTAVTPEPVVFVDESRANSRSAFFNVAFRNEDGVTEISDKQPFFDALLDAWQDPQDKKLDALSLQARKEPAVFKLAYISTLGRFKNSDKAVLKLLDFIRTQDELELRSVIKALTGIGNNRAGLELISAITRPNITTNLQLEIIQALHGFELSALQLELRSALSDLPQNLEVANDSYEVKESLEALISAPLSGAIPVAEAKVVHIAGKQDEDLDVWLRSRLDRFEELSSEVRRALRTARFFHYQVQSTKQSSTIDLSPAIDMQYKALELAFREMFEGACSEFIDTGVVQRKLDVIGYARPIEHQMDQFESFINNLPVVSTIPFFSKFKMRKMLRAICQYKPGRRFTLDGIKAFGLFFLTFGRKEDKFGLANLFPLPFERDEDLFKFCKALHMFQDIRNRAAHEGFQPDASNDIDAIWQATADIFKGAFLIKDHLKVHGNPRPRMTDQTFEQSRNKKQPVVEIIHKRSAS